MRKNNKDYKPWDEYLASQARKNAIAKDVADQVLAVTASHNVDVDMVSKHLRRGLLSTEKAAGCLGISCAAFLRLRRKYGLEPIQKSWMFGETHHRFYRYSRAQLARIPSGEIALAKRRSALARRVKKSRKRSPVIDGGLDLKRLRERAA